MTLLIIYVAGALLFSFLCSIAEAVILSVRPPYVANLEQTRPHIGKLLRSLKDDIDRPLAAILSLNTIAHTVGAAGAGAQAAFVFGSQYLGLASAILTLLILVLSEIIPKTLGALYWRQLAPFVAYGLKITIRVLYPLVYFSEKLTKLLSRGRVDVVFSRREFAAMAELGAKHGHLATQESQILKNLLHLNALKAQDIMTPRTVIMALPQTMTIDEVMHQHPEMNFSRIPIYAKDKDDITGFVLKSDILLMSARDLKDKKLHELKRELKAVPEGVSLSDLFEFLLDNREHIVVVVDEYGGVAGLVTMEDVLETLLGLEIVDEADKTVDMRALARAQWKKRARDLGLIPQKSEQASEEQR